MFDVCVRISVFVLSSVQVEALRRADHPSKESYRLQMNKKLRNQPYAPKWEQEGKKLSIVLIKLKFIRRF
jgi:hypothetical protein